MKPFEKQSPLSSFNMPLFSVVAGVLVANLYYAQPLLAQIAENLDIAAEQAGFLITLVQLGYAAGVLFIVPLGDSLNRRNMVSSMLVLCVLALVAVAVSPTFLALAIAFVLVGLSSSAIMVIIPYVASHAHASVRGKRVGQVMTGLFLGILMGRTASGVLAHQLGWRWMYGLAAGVVTLSIIMLRWRMVPDEKSGKSLNYARLMVSIFQLAREEKELRWRAGYAMLGLCSFSALWTGLTFLLSDPPFHYNTATIGSFGLIGAAGALSANLAGRLGDRGYARTMTGLFGVLLTLSWAALWFGKTSLVPLIFGIFIADVAVQGLQVTHQSVLYQLAPHARSRITSVFITMGFVGMSLGSALASTGYAHWGWKGACLAGAGAAALLPLGWVVHSGFFRRRAEESFGQCR